MRHCSTRPIAARAGYVCSSSRDGRYGILSTVVNAAANGSALRLGSSAHTSKHGARPPKPRRHLASIPLIEPANRRGRWRDLGRFSHSVSDGRVASCLRPGMCRREQGGHPWHGTAVAVVAPRALSPGAYVPPRALVLALLPRTGALIKNHVWMLRLSVWMPAKKPR